MSRLKSLNSRQNTKLSRVEAFLWSRGRSRRSRKVPNLIFRKTVRLLGASYVVAAASCEHAEDARRGRVRGDCLRSIQASEYHGLRKPELVAVQADECAHKLQRIDAVVLCLRAPMGGCRSKPGRARVSEPLQRRLSDTYFHACTTLGGRKRVARLRQPGRGRLSQQARCRCSICYSKQHTSPAA